MKSYKNKYLELDSVAIMQEQAEIHAPEHEHFKDSNGDVREVKCPQCPASYSIGYPRFHGPGDEPFEALAERLRKFLANDHEINARHRPAISVGE